MRIAALACALLAWAPLGASAQPTVRAPRAVRIAALACALLAWAPLGASAQPTVRVAGPRCPPAWWDDGAFLDALRVELAREPVAIERAGVEATDGVALVVTRPACDDTGETLVVALADEAQSVSLADLPPDARTRTLAITTADRVMALLAARAGPAPEAARVSDAAPDPAPLTEAARVPDAARDSAPLTEAAPVDAAPEPEAAPVTETARALAAEHRAPRLSTELGVPRTPAAIASVDAGPAPVEPAAPSGLELRVHVSGLVLATASTLQAFGGGTVAAELSFGAVPLAIRLAPILFYGGAGHALGRVLALGGGGTLGAGLDLRASFVRIVPRLELGVVHVVLDATATAPDVAAHDAERDVVWVQPGVSVGVEVDAFFLALELGVPLVARGAEARAGDQPVLSVTGALLRAELAVGARVGL